MFRLGIILLALHHPIFLLTDRFIGYTFANDLAFQMKMIAGLLICLSIKKDLDYIVLAIYFFGISLCFWSDFFRMPFYVNQTIGVYSLSILLILPIWNYVKSLLRGRT